MNFFGLEFDRAHALFFLLLVFFVFLTAFLLATKPVQAECVVQKCEESPSERYLKLYIKERLWELDANVFGAMAFGTADGRFWWQDYRNDFVGFLCAPNEANLICCRGGLLDSNRLTVIEERWGERCYG